MKTHSRDNDSKNADYLELIRDIYKGEGFRLASGAKQLKDKHDGLIYDDCLCLRGTKLLEKINQTIPAAKLDDVIKGLLSENALKTGTDKRSIQIYGCGGKRFYAIKLKKLK